MVDKDLLAVDFEANENPAKKAIVAIRKGRGNLLRGAGVTNEIDDDWDKVEILYHDEDKFLSEILWHTTDVKIIEPTSLSANLVSRVTAMVRLNG